MALDAVPDSVTLIIKPPPATQLFPEVIAVNCPVCDHARLATAIVCEAKADSALNAGSSVTEPSVLVHALATVQITVPEVFAPEPYSMRIKACEAESQSEGISTRNCAAPPLDGASCKAPPRLFVPPRP